MEHQSHTTTRLIARWQAGDKEAEEALFSRVYRDLRRLAAYRMRMERAEHTLDPTALVHEAYVRMVANEPNARVERAHFLAIASRVMRQVLVDHARGRLAEKRGGCWARVTLAEDRVASSGSEELIAIHAALEKLAELSPRQARVVEMRYYGGLSVDETAQALRVSQKTVKRDWSVARRWLYRELQMGAAESGS